MLLKSLRSKIPCAIGRRFKAGTRSDFDATLMEGGTKQLL
jgi:hypothetical protein